MKYVSEREKKVKETKPFEPFVSKEQIQAFDPERQETYTESRLVNEVLLAIEQEGMREPAEIAAYLGLNKVVLLSALRLVSSLKVNDILRIRMIDKLLKIKEENPEIKPDEAARAVGYSDHGTIFKILGREEYDRLFAKYKWRPGRKK